MQTQRRSKRLTVNWLSNGIQIRTLVKLRKRQKKCFKILVNPMKYCQIRNFEPNTTEANQSLKTKEAGNSIMLTNFSISTLEVEIGRAHV